MKKIIFTEEQKKDIVDQYLKYNKTMKEIAIIFNVSPSTISRLLKEQNIQSKQGRFIDETGNRYSHLLVIELNGYENNRAMWKCKCDCGKERIVNGKYLRNGDTKSCGCLTNYNNLLGKTFGKLTVIEKTEKRVYKSIVWKCRCACGNIKDYPSKTLVTGDAVSCGLCECKSKGELKIQELLETNNIAFSREYKNSTCKDKRVLPFDFAIFENNKLLYLIEFDGKQHFYAENGWNDEEKLRITQKHDNIKNQWCKENNIPLIRIPYTHYDNLCLEDLLLKTSKFIII